MFTHAPRKRGEDAKAKQVEARKSPGVAKMKKKKCELNTRTPKARGVDDENRGKI